ncbi:MAG: hypothetical protein ABI541_09620, partial [Betaproteobacteria bacterium]
MRTPPFDGKRGNASSVAAGRHERQAALACRGFGEPRRSSDAAPCVAEKSIIVTAASRRECLLPTPAKSQPAAILFCMRCVADIRMLAKYTPAPRLDWSRFADATAGDGPNDAM